MARRLIGNAIGILVCLTFLALELQSQTTIIHRRHPIPPPPPASGGYVLEGQVENSDNAAGVSSVVAPAISVNAGDLLVVVVGFDAAANPAGTMSSSPSNTWTQIGTGVHDGSQYGMRAYYSYNSASGSTVCTWTASMSYPSIAVYRFSGIRSASNPLTGTPAFGNQATPGTGTDGVTSGNTTPGAQPALVFGFAFDVLGTTPAPTAGTGYTSTTGVWDYDGAIAVCARAEHKRVTSTSATAATFTAGVNERHFSVVAAFLEP